MRINIGHNIIVATLVSLKKRTAAMLVSPSNPQGIEIHSYANIFFCFGWKNMFIDHMIENTLYHLISY